MKQLSNLPPGCTNNDIEINAGCDADYYPDFYPEEPEELDIADDDYVISDARNGYYVSQIEENFSDYDAAVQAIVDDMENNQFWPNVWTVNDHGNVDLLSINTETMETKIVQSWV